MDSSDHPVVQRGIKAAELISDVSKSLSGETLSLFTHWVEPPQLAPVCLLFFA